MMSRVFAIVRPFALLIVVAQLISGCAFLYTFDDQLEQRLDAWVAQHEYSKALSTLEYLRPTHAQYNQLLKKKQQIIALSKAFADDTMRRAQQLTKNNQWQEADNVYQYGLDKIQDNKLLQSAYQDFSKQRERYLNTLHYQLAIHKAQWLNKSASLQRELVRATPNDSTVNRALQQHDDEVQNIYQALLRCGMDSLQLNELELAEQCLLLAEQIHPGGKSHPALGQVQQQLALREKRQPATVAPRQTEELVDMSKQAMEKNNLKLAQKFFNQIPEKDQQLVPVKKFKKVLEERIANNISQGIEMGRKLYSQGEVENALAVWNDLRELDQDNEQLASHIERATRVLNKLKMLKKNEPVVAPPSASKGKS